MPYTSSVKALAILLTVTSVTWGKPGHSRRKEKGAAAAHKKGIDLTKNSPLLSHLRKKAAEYIQSHPTVYAHSQVTVEDLVQGSLLLISAYYDPRQTLDDMVFVGTQFFEASLKNYTKAYEEKAR